MESIRMNCDSKEGAQDYINIITLDTVIGKTISIRIEKSDNNCSVHLTPEHAGKLARDMIELLTDYLLEIEE